MGLVPEQGAASARASRGEGKLYRTRRFIPRGHVQIRRRRARAARRRRQTSECDREPSQCSAEPVRLWIPELAVEPEAREDAAHLLGLRAAGGLLEAGGIAGGRRG